MITTRYSKRLQQKGDEREKGREVKRKTSSKCAHSLLYILTHLLYILTHFSSGNSAFSI